MSHLGDLANCSQCGACFVKDAPNAKTCDECRRRRRVSQDRVRAKQRAAVRHETKPTVPIGAVSVHIDLSLDVDGSPMTLNEYRHVRDEAPVVHFVAAS